MCPLNPLSCLPLATPVPEAITDALVTDARTPAQSMILASTTPSPDAIVPATAVAASASAPDPDPAPGSPAAVTPAPVPATALPTPSSPEQTDQMIITIDDDSGTGSSIPEPTPALAFVNPLMRPYALLPPGTVQPHHRNLILHGLLLQPWPEEVLNTASAQSTETDPSVSATVSAPFAMASGLLNRPLRQRVLVEALRDYMGHTSHMRLDEDNLYHILAARNLVQLMRSSEDVLPSLEPAVQTAIRTLLELWETAGLQ